MVKSKEKKAKKVAEGTSRHTRRKKAAKVSVLAILVIIALFLVLVAGYSISYAKKVYANVTLGDINLGGKNKTDVSNLVKTRSEEFLKNKINLKYRSDGEKEQSYTIEPSDIGLVFDTDRTADVAFGYGRDGSIIRNFGEQLVSLIKPHRIDAVYTVNQEALTQKIADIAEEIDVPEKDYEISYAGEGKFELKDMKQTGKRIPRSRIDENIHYQITNIASREYLFANELYEPKVTAENAAFKLKSANKILSEGELKLTFLDFAYSLDVDTIGGLIKSRPHNDDLELYLDESKAAKQVEAISANINRAPVNAVLQATATGVSAFQLSQDGRELDQKATISAVGNSLLARSTDGVTDIDTKSVKLTVKVTQPEISSASLEQYGLRELVATGTTDFRKSPSNRVHNITIGANAINGTLIKPGEEFSTLSRLGKIDASTGYLPELVIKNNKTLPDYGGGLCQVSTTLFRTALNAGMKITSRRNHSYRVSYYEPPVGMDATIFDPAPDFKFINNYNSHILVQSKIVGTKITFEFYGTKDSRQVTISTPEVSEYIEPPAPVETIDPNLPPGTRNLVSHSHQGATAKFHYEVAKDGETLQSTDFTSKYVALPEMWSVGPSDPAAEQAPAADATTPAPAT